MRMSVSDIDSYRFFRDYNKPLDVFLSELRRQAPPRPQMLAGTALHNALERMQISGSNVAEINTVGGIDCPVVNLADIDIELPIPKHGVPEVYCRKWYDTSVGPVDMRGKVDVVAGNTIYDYKLTSNPNPEFYQDAMQWRAYLDMMGANTMTYIVFGFSERKNILSPFSIEYHVNSCNPYTFYRYDGMVDDLLEAVTEFASFCKEAAPDLFARR